MIEKISTLIIACFCVLYSSYVIKTDDSNYFIQYEANNTEFTPIGSNFEIVWPWILLLSPHISFIIALVIICVYYNIYVLFRLLNSNIWHRYIGLFIILLPASNISTYLGSTWRLQFGLAVFLFIARNIGPQFSLFALLIHSAVALPILALFIATKRYKSIVIYAMLTLLCILTIEEYSNILNITFINRVNHYNNYETEYIFKSSVAFLILINIFVFNKFLNKENLMIIIILSYYLLVFLISEPLASRIFNTFQFLIPVILLREIKIKC